MYKETNNGRHSMPLQAFGIRASVLRIAFLTTVISNLAVAGSVYAAPSYGVNPQQKMMNQDAQQKPLKKSDEKMEHSPEAMARHVEERIKTLHQKLGITSEQEEKWGECAQTMRDNEATIAALIETRHKNAKTMTALDDLQSYREITQAHVDGLKKLTPVFQALYEEMPEDQQKTADKVFGSFEGHGDKSARKQK